MLHEYAFDVKLFAVIRVKAKNEEEARKILADFEDEINIGASLTAGEGEAVLTSASTDGTADLFEIDGEDA